jgi:methionyl aminopeptidase
MRGRDRIQYKTVDQVRLMRTAGLIVADALDAVRAALAPGLTTAYLDRIANQVIVGKDAVPSFLNYGHPPYPATLCISVNDEVVHGIPGSRALVAGDVVSVDCGAIFKGWHGDSAFTAVVPSAPGHDDPRSPEQVAEDAALIDVTEQALWTGIAAIVAGDRLNAVGAAIEDLVGDRYGLVEEYGGHGIGTEMHQEPAVPNFGKPGRGHELVKGLALAVEPMLNLGGRRTRLLGDGWTVVTKDGLPSAHFEHTFTLTDEGPLVLTALDGGKSKLAALTAVG